MLGYALGTILPGFLQTKIKKIMTSARSASSVGDASDFGWSLLGLLFGGLAAWHAHAEWKKAQLGGSVISAACESGVER